MTYVQILDSLGEPELSFNPRSFGFFLGIVSELAGFIS